VGVFNVLDYASLQAAFTAIPNNSILIIPKGTYTVTGLTLTNKNNITSTGGGTLLISGTNGYGIKLVGTEVKSLREGKLSFNDAYCFIIESEIWLKGLYIGEYSNASHVSHATVQDRKLLLTKKEIKKIELKFSEKGYTIFPLKMFFNEITHFGEGVELDNNKVKNTLVDFYVMATSKKIYSFSVYDHGTGFSRWCAETYNIPYVGHILK
jgi:SsrA-binding protein